MKKINKTILLALCFLVLMPVCVYALGLRNDDKPFIDIEAIIGHGSDLTLNTVDAEQNNDESETETVKQDVQVIPTAIPTAVPTITPKEEKPVEKTTVDIKINSRQIYIDEELIEDMAAFKEKIDSVKPNKKVYLYEGYSEYYTYEEVKEYLDEKGIKYEEKP